VRAQLLALDAERTRIFLLRAAQAEQIKNITAERDALRAEAQQPTSNPLQTPFTFGSLGVRAAVAGTTSGMSLGADTAVSGTTSSVYTQGAPPKHLVAPITSRSAREFREYVIAKKREQRHVRYDALISNPARRLISLRFRLLAEQPGFCNEFPQGARGAEELERLDLLAANPESWYLGWQDKVFVDCLVRAFPKETEGSAAVTQTLEELFNKITLKISVTDKAPLNRYLGEVHERMELAAPLIPGNEVQCVKRLHAGFSGVGADTATAAFKYQLDTTFGGRLPLTIGGYLLEMER
jgi:hypothetical protein